MLVPKLLRLDDTTIKEIEQLSQKLSKKEYISFSALVRAIIRKDIRFPISLLVFARIQFRHRMGTTTIRISGAHPTFETLNLYLLKHNQFLLLLACTQSLRLID